MWLLIVLFCFMTGIHCVLKCWVFSVKYLTRDKVNFGKAKIQRTTNGFLKKFKLDSIQSCKKKKKNPQ